MMFSSYLFQRNDYMVKREQLLRGHLVIVHDEYLLKSDVDQRIDPTHSSSIPNQYYQPHLIYRSHWNYTELLIAVISQLMSDWTWWFQNKQTQNTHTNFFSCRRSRIVQLYSVANTRRKILFFMCTIPLTNRIVTSPSPAPISNNCMRLNRWSETIEHKQMIANHFNRIFYLKWRFRCLQPPIDSHWIRQT